MAWDFRGTGKTVVRAGASILRDAEIAEQLAAGGAGGTPFGANFPSVTPAVNNSGTDLNAHTPNRVTLSNTQLNWTLAGPVFPTQSVTIGTTTFNGITCAPSGFGGSKLASPCTTQATYPNFLQPGAAEWNLDIQRAITNWSLTTECQHN